MGFNEAYEMSIFKQGTAASLREFLQGSSDHPIRIDLTGSGILSEGRGWFILRTSLSGKYSMMTNPVLWGRVLV